MTGWKILFHRTEGPLGTGDWVAIFNVLLSVRITYHVEKKKLLGQRTFHKKSI